MYSHALLHPVNDLATAMTTRCQRRTGQDRDMEGEDKDRKKGGGNENKLDDEN